MFRESSPEAESLSAYLRHGTDGSIDARRRITALYLGGSAALGVVAAYQMGLLHRVPEPRLPFLDADRVDASGEAYGTLRIPDAVLGLVSYGIIGSRDERRSTTSLGATMAAGRCRAQDPSRRRLRRRADGRTARQAPRALFLVRHFGGGIMAIGPLGVT